MEDISPELFEKLQTAFYHNLSADKHGQELLKILENGGNYEQAGLYADVVGQALSQAFSEHLSSAVLPDGKMYWNIAQNVIMPLLKQDHKLVSGACATAQQNINKDLQIGIKPVTAEFNQDRATAILNKVSNAPQYDEAEESLLRAVQNFSRGVVDDSVKANADFHGKSGLHPVIIRKTDGKCCKWCSSLAGVYQYPEVPKEVYQRHDNCGCTVDYKPDKYGTKVQNVHTGTEGKRKYIKNEYGSYDKRESVEKRKAKAKAMQSEAAEKEKKAKESRKTVGLLQKPGKETIDARKTIGLLDENGRRSVDNSGDGGIIKSGGISGALKSSSKEAKEHAVQYYASVRKMKDDVLVIANNTGFSAEDITNIKNFVFLQKHDLGGDTPEYFVPSYDMAQTWQRLIDGKNIQKHDLTLLKHESLEKELIDQGKSQEEAHLIASAKYNYSMEVREYNDKIAKHSKK